MPFLLNRFVFAVVFGLLALNGGAALAPTSSAAAATSAPMAPVITVRTGVHPDFDRIVFDWPRGVSYTVSKNGSQVVVQFAAAGQPRFGGDTRLLTRAKGFSSSTDAQGHLTVAFSVGAKASVKDFTSDKSVVLDIEGDTAASTMTTSNVAKPVAALASTPAPVTETKPAALPVIVAQPSVPTVPPVPRAAPSPAPVDGGLVATPRVTPSTTPTKAAVPVALTTPPPLPSAVRNMPAVAAALSALAADLSDKPVLVASMDPHTPTRAVIYVRAGYGYIIFDRKLTLNMDALTSGQPPLRVAMEAMDLQKASGFRFPVPFGAEIHASLSDTTWQLYLTQQQPEVPVSTSLIAQPDFALGARYILPLPDSPEPVPITDPVVGDELILIPLAQTEAFSSPRRMADFRILPAAQGLVIKPLTDKLIVRSVTDGLEITAEGGLRLSSANDTGSSQQSSQKARAAAAGKSIFDFATWQGKPGESFTQTRQRLQQTIVDVPDAERNRARLELARFYFAHGYGEEAVGLLNYLVGQVPDLMAHADFIALMGASKILAYRAQEGLKDLDTPLLAHQPEIELWQAVGEAQLRDWTSAEEKFSVTEGLLNGYPEPFYSRFTTLAIEAALAANKDREGADWLDHLENNPHRDSIEPAISYLHGVLQAKAGRAAAAEEDWKLTDGGHDRLYKIRAELALVDLAVSTHSLTPAQAADRLEALRFGWRGDDLEVDILHRLGEFYIQAKNVKAGLNTLSKAVQLYPDSPLTPPIRAEMSNIFHDVFLTDLGKDLPPLDSLTLYQQYHNLMPSGSDGIATTRNLAERLVAIDLLDQAADLLEDLVKNRLQGEAKARTASRLAAIRLLDHKPDAALAALDMAKDETLPADAQNERLLLRAKALADLHRDDEALALLHDNNSQPVKILRADINMHGQHWSDAGKALMDLIGPPPKSGVALTADQTQWLVNCAIAYSLAGDQAGIDRLAIDYGAAMAGTPESDTFRILTQPENAAQMKDIAAAQARISDVDMFQGFLNNYRKTEDATDKK